MDRIPFFQPKLPTAITGRVNNAIVVLTAVPISFVLIIIIVVLVIVDILIVSISIHHHQCKTHDTNTHISVAIVWLSTIAVCITHLPQSRRHTTTAVQHHSRRLVVITINFQSDDDYYHRHLCGTITVAIALTRYRRVNKQQHHHHQQLSWNDPHGIGRVAPITITATDDGHSWQPQFADR
jgi:hypothetical protein